jgi:hypothetical protein
MLNYIIILFVFRYSNPNAAQQQSSSSAQPGEDLTPDYMNVLVKKCTYILPLQGRVYLRSAIYKQSSMPSTAISLIFRRREFLFF